MKIRNARVAFLAVCVTLLLACGHSEQPQANRAVKLIEEFVTTHHRLPNDLCEVRLKCQEDGPIYYRKDNEREYIVWYGTRLGSSVIYESKTRKWDNSE